MQIWFRSKESSVVATARASVNEKNMGQRHPKLPRANKVNNWTELACVWHPPLTTARGFRTASPRNWMVKLLTQYWKKSRMTANTWLFLSNGTRRYSCSHRPLWRKWNIQSLLAKTGGNYQWCPYLWSR